ncbi:universal stress protein [Ideonella livida]|uniref:Universal stress protein n=1 Tax=Ideonella livida TaxID=2707176 RepID=A0A7C9TIJ2_9BURK|nr:universal stress protein [Ideonella livida]NDY91280.1 universal stress protein [Ideonella livida]
MLHYLIPTDGSDVSLDAVRHVLRLRRHGLQCQVVLAHVREPVHLYEVVLAPDVEVLEQAGQGAAAHALQPALALLQAAGLEAATEVVTGDPAHELAPLAERCGCDAIVISTAGQGWLSNDRVGRVAEAVLHHATVPVTLVRRVDLEEASAEEASDGDTAEA